MVLSRMVVIGSQVAHDANCFALRRVIRNGVTYTGHAAMFGVEWWGEAYTLMSNWFQSQSEYGSWVSYPEGAKW